MTILTGDCRDFMPAHRPFDMILADPPYGDTSLAWDHHVEGWITLACKALRPSGSMWLFGSLRAFMAITAELYEAGFRYAQEVVWEKQNGSGFHADRIKRVHELAAQGRLSGRRYIGCEIDPDMAARARARIATVLPFHDGGPS